MMLSLSVLEGDRLRGKTVAIDPPVFLIGRLSRCHLRSVDSQVSRLHCLVTREGTRAYLRDLGSTTGTFVNDRMIIAEVELCPGDRIQVGQMKLEFGAHPALATGPLDHKVAMMPVGNKGQLASRMEKVGRLATKTRLAWPAARKWVGLAVAVAVLVAMIGGFLSLRTRAFGSSQAAPRPVTGTVTLDHTPLGQALILFIPKGATRGSGASAVTRSDGTFELIMGEGRELPPGSYTVVISKLARTSARLQSRGPSPNGAGGETLHPNYSDPAKSVLSATVPDGGGQIDFILARSGKKTG